MVASTTTPAPSTRFSSVPAMRGKPRPVISYREAEVLRLIGYGFRNSAIAEKLGVATKTVDSYKEHLKIKLNCTGSELVLAAHQFGLCAVQVTGQLFDVYPTLCDNKRGHRVAVADGETLIAFGVMLRPGQTASREMIDAMREVMTRHGMVITGETVA